MLKKISLLLFTTMALFATAPPPTDGAGSCSAPSIILLYIGTVLGIDLYVPVFIPGNCN